MAGTSVAAVEPMRGPLSDEPSEGQTEPASGDKASRLRSQDRRQPPTKRPRTRNARLDADTFDALWRLALRKVRVKGRSHT